MLNDVEGVAEAVDALSPHRVLLVVTILLVLNLAVKELEISDQVANVSEE